MKIELNPPATTTATRQVEVQVAFFQIVRVEFLTLDKVAVSTFDWIGFDSNNEQVASGTVRLEGERGLTVFNSLVPTEVYKEIASSLGTSFVEPTPIRK